MYQSEHILRTPADFDNAIIFGLKVEVWQQNEIIDSGSFIKSHTDDAVTFLNNLKYLNAACDFKVR